MIAVPVAGTHYPRSLGELRSWFATGADCLDYLEWLRWPDGFVCPDCGQLGGWRLGDGRFRCATCRSCTSATAGTIFDRTRTPRLSACRPAAPAATLSSTDQGLTQMTGGSGSDHRSSAPTSRWRP